MNILYLPSAHVQSQSLVIICVLSRMSFKLAFKCLCSIFVFLFHSCHTLHLLFPNLQDVFTQGIEKLLVITLLTFSAILVTFFYSVYYDIRVSVSSFLCLFIMVFYNSLTILAICFSSTSPLFDLIKIHALYFTHNRCIL